MVCTRNTTFHPLSNNSHLQANNQDKMGCEEENILLSFLMRCSQSWRWTCLVSRWSDLDLLEPRLDDLLRALAMSRSRSETKPCLNVWPANNSIYIVSERDKVWVMDNIVWIMMKTFSTVTGQQQFMISKYTFQSTIIFTQIPGKIMIIICMFWRMFIPFVWDRCLVLCSGVEI